MAMQYHLLLYYYTAGVSLLPSRHVAGLTPESSPMNARLCLLVPFAMLTLSACRHLPPLTTVTTRENGVVKLCGKYDDGDKRISGVSPEGSKVSISQADVVTMETNGTCKK